MALSESGVAGGNAAGKSPDVEEPTRGKDVGMSLQELRVQDPWKQFANCLGVDPDLFFPERGASTKEAKRVCSACDVRDECLEYALDNGEKFGIWGGMSERERRRVRRERALARRQAEGAATA